MNIMGAGVKMEDFTVICGLSYRDGVVKMEDFTVVCVLSDRVADRG